MPEVLDAVDTAERATLRNGVLKFSRAADAAGIYTDIDSIQSYARKAGRDIRAEVAKLAIRAKVGGAALPEDDEVESLFNALDGLFATGRIRTAIQKIFATMNSWLCQGRFDLCRKAIGQVDPKKLGPDLALSFLTITFAAKQWVNPSRAKLLKELREFLEDSRGARVAEVVLRNLE